MKIINSRIFFTSFLSFLLSNDVIADDQHQVEFKFDSFSYSEVMPVIETFGGVIPVGRIGKETSFSSKPDEGRQALTHNRAFQRYQYDKFIVQLTARYDYDIRFTPDAAQLFFIDRNDRPIDKNAYDLFFSAKHIRANGIGIGYEFNYQQLTIKALLNYWNVQNMENGQVAGQFTLNQDVEDTFEVTGEIDYRYFEDALLDRQNCPNTDPPVAGCHGSWITDGYGYNLDFEFAYIFNDLWQLNGVVYDAFSRFKFDKLGHTLGELNTQNEIINPDGSFSVRPSFSGQYLDGEHDLTIHTQAKVRLDGELWLPVWSEIYRANGKTFPSAGIGYRMWQTRFELGYMLEANAGVFNIKHKNFHLGVVAETVDFGAARTLVLNFGFNASW